MVVQTVMTINSCNFEAIADCHSNHSARRTHFPAPPRTYPEIVDDPVTSFVPSPDYY